MRHTHARLLTSWAAPLAAGALVLSGLAAPPAAADTTLLDRVVGDAVQRQGTTAPQKAQPGGALGLASADRPIRRTVTLDEFAATPVPPADAQRFTRVEVTQNIAKGQLVAQAHLADEPSAATNAAVAIYLGERSGSQCIAGAAMVAETAGPGADGGFLPQGANVGVKRSRSGAVVTLRSSAAVAQVRAAEWNCAFARVATLDGATALHSTLWGTLEDVHAPRLIIKPGVPVQGNYAGKVTKIRLEVRNDSPTPAAGVRLRAAGKSMKIAKPVRNLGRLDGRSTKYGVVYNVRLQGAKARKLTFRATTGGRTFTKSITIARKPKPTRLPSLAGRYFWGHMGASTNTGWDNRAAYFANNRFVHLGFPKAGKRPVCRKASKTCKRYTYNARTGSLKIAKAKPVRVTSEGFTFRKATYYPTTLAKKGQRFNVELMRYDFNGNCLIFCTTWTEWLALKKNGQFVLSRMTIGSWGGPGAGGQWSNVPPDDKGSYKVIAPGRVQLNFANGKKQRHTLAIDHDVRNKPSPRGAGLILGDRNFYFND